MGVKQQTNKQQSIRHLSGKITFLMNPNVNTYCAGIYYRRVVMREWNSLSNHFEIKIASIVCLLRI